MLTRVSCKWCHLKLRKYKFSINIIFSPRNGVFVVIIFKLTILNIVLLCCINVQLFFIRRLRLRKK